MTIRTGNPGTLLRLWEQAGESGELAITFPAGMTVTTATPVNLRGEKIRPPLLVTKQPADRRSAGLFAGKLCLALTIAQRGMSSCRNGPNACKQQLAVLASKVT